jgi:hypothetical protein
MNDHDRDIFEAARRLLGGLGALGIAALSGTLTSKAAETDSIADSKPSAVDNQGSRSRPGPPC